ncbi:hypothetical protein PsorP6_009784 [Peronosclerospora sorghi]|uniref:Uncharacterized protein n=1 Tax=Peronosclerospora sorghi TaxID=230839 RepID=A0ACC0VYF1_9STRA|nr:hypothetical protein PsorP6_009784 [Peronosclerospora sorghi]
MSRTLSRSEQLVIDEMEQILRMPKVTELDWKLNNPVPIEIATLSDQIRPALAFRIVRINSASTVSEGNNSRISFESVKKNTKYESVFPGPDGLVKITICENRSGTNSI